MENILTRKIKVNRFFYHLVAKTRLFPLPKSNVTTSFNSGKCMYVFRKVYIDIYSVVFLNLLHPFSVGNKLRVCSKKFIPPCKC